MSDEDARPMGTMTPALPSRATGETKPLTPLPDEVDRAMSLPTRPAPVPETPRRARRKTTRTARERLPAREIKRINRNRRKNLKKSRKPTRRAAAPAPAKSPNRPLEAKNRLHRVMAAVASMAKPETQAFLAMMQHLEDMSRSQRQRVITALQTVYS